jgi:tetratricopeptide (TPR) repeat protein
LYDYKELIRKLMAILGGFLGVVYRDSLNDKVPRDYDKVYAIYWHNRYHKHFSKEAFNEAISAINIGLEKNPESSLLTAFKAELYLNLRAMDVEGEIDFHQEGLKLVSKAIDLDQNNQHAWQVKVWANILQHDKKEFLRSAEQCLAINPNNAMYVGAIGFGYECMGEYEIGLELMSESISLNPYYPWEMNIGFCFYYLSHGEYDEAHQWAEKINRKALVWDPLLRASTLGHLGLKEEAIQVLDEIYSLSPNFPERARIIISAFILDEELQSTIIEGLILAGMELTD